VTGRRRAASAALALALTPASFASDNWTAPPEARARANPVPSSPEALAKGQALYQRHCGKCHGPRGRGDGPAARFGPEPASDLTAPKTPRTDGEVFWKLSTGRKEGPEIVMPGFTKDIASEEDRWKVVLFVRTLEGGAAKANGT
jgi:mono/diheme cytochrome c family protein